MHTRTIRAFEHQGRTRPNTVRLNSVVNDIEQKFDVDKGERSQGFKALQVVQEFCPKATATTLMTELGKLDKTARPKLIQCLLELRKFAWLTESCDNTLSDLDEVTEAHVTNPIIVNATTDHKDISHAKILLYSPVVNMDFVGKHDKLQLEPWLHYIALPDMKTVIGYVWDTREILTVAEDAKLAKRIKTVDALNNAIADPYSVYNGAALKNSAKRPDASYAMKLLRDWVEPSVLIRLYKQDKKRGIYEFDIDMHAPNHGDEMYMGSYIYDGRVSKVDLDVALISDVFKLVKKRDQKKFRMEQRDFLAFKDIKNWFHQNLITITK